MVVVDDFLNKDTFLLMRAAIMAASFPWEKSGVIGRPGMDMNAPDNVQDVHGFFLHKPGIRYQSPRFGIIQPVVQQLAPRGLLRIKVNRTPRQGQHIEYGMHVDTRCPGATTAVFYLNDNNGHTLFEDGYKVASVANRLVMFDATKLHTGVSCTDTPYRLVLNINMLEPKFAQPA